MWQVLYSVCYIAIHRNKTDLIPGSWGLQIKNEENINQITTQLLKYFCDKCKEEKCDEEVVLIVFLLILILCNKGNESINEDLDFSYRDFFQV